MQKPKCKKNGFTLVEVLVASVLIAIGITGLLAAMATSTQSNAAGNNLAQATLLAQEIRERTVAMSFDDIGNLSGQVYSPPVDSTGTAMEDMTQWSQSITVTFRDASDISATVEDGTSDVVYVEVIVSMLGNEVCRTGWIVANREE